jgi:hypothetical protein
LLLRCLEAAEKLGFAFFFDGGAELDVAARAVFAGFENLHRASQPGEALIASMTSSICVDFAGQSSANAGHIPKVKTTASPADRIWKSLPYSPRSPWCAPTIGAPRGERVQSRQAGETILRAFGWTFGP